MKNIVFALVVVLLPSFAVAQTWVEHPVTNTFRGPKSVCAVDMNGDGEIDILAAGARPGYEGHITYWRNNGAGSSWSEYVLDNNFPGASSVYGGDLDGDGDMDVVGSAYDTNTISWWETLDFGPPQWDEHQIASGFDAVSCVCVADVDGDGDDDVLGAARDDNDITWWENAEGTGLVWTQHAIDDQFDGAFNVSTVDMDEDGDLDVVGAAYDADDISWWENVNGDGSSWEEHLVVGDANGAINANAADVDGDGDLDILGAARVDNLLLWWENVDGNGTEWAEHPLSGYFYGAHCVYGQDMDLDGDIDVLGAAREANTIAWWENSDGDGLSWVEHIVDDSFDDPWYVVPADIDGDGMQDILSGAYFGDDIVWWGLDEPFPLRVVSPNGGETWRRNTTQTLRWVPGAQELVYIELIEGPIVIEVISVGTENDGEYDWTISNDIPLGDNYRIRLTLLSGSEQDVSDAPFSVASLPSLTLTPYDPPVTITPDGDGFFYWAEVFNPSSASATGQFWTEVELPNGALYGPLSLSTITVPGNSTWSPVQPFAQWVPSYAPAGTYQFIANAGIFPSRVLASDSFSFEKLNADDIDVKPRESWNLSDWSQPVGEYPTQPGAEVDLDAPHELLHINPNPFNSATTIELTLPDGGEVTMVMYNVMGQKVAALADGSFRAGTHRFTFDGSQLSSGLYFLHTQVAGRENQFQKLMLVR